MNNKNQKKSFEILETLDTHINSEDFIVKQDKNTKSDYMILNFIEYNCSIFLLLLTIFFVIFLVVYYAVLSKVLLNVNLLPRVVNLTLHLLIFLAYVCAILIFTKFICFLLKDVKSKAIDRTKIYDFQNYQEMISKLSKKFSKEDLNNEEIRFEIAIRERKRRSKIVQKLNPLLAILMIGFGFGILRFDFLKDNFKLFYGTIVGTSGIVLLARIFLDILLAFLDEDIEIYETCILILQKAQLDFKNRNEIDNR